MIEEWKPINGFKGYEISNCGRVRSISGLRPRVMKPLLLKCAAGPGRKERRYPRAQISIRKNKKSIPKTFMIHRLVLNAFVGPRPKGMQCCHFDGDSSNNHLSNLRWDTAKNNYLDRKRHGTWPSGKNNGNWRHGRNVRSPNPPGN